MTLGHWPQSIDLSTVGGWLACRGAGQLSTRYGKIEDMVVGLDVVLADGTGRAHGRHAPRGGRPRPEPAVRRERGNARDHHRRPASLAPGTERGAAGGVSASRRSRTGSTRAGASCNAARRRRSCACTTRSRANGTSTSATSTCSSCSTRATRTLVDATCRSSPRSALTGAPVLDDTLVDRWLEHRNDVSALEALVSRGFVVDTMEIAGRVARPARDLRPRAGGHRRGRRHRSRRRRTSRTRTPTARASTSRSAGAARPTRATTTTAPRGTPGRGPSSTPAASLSHHHGVGLNRARFVREALGDAFGVLAAAKAALDPHGILNPGKLGFDSPFGPSPAWP